MFQPATVFASSNSLVDSAQLARVSLITQPWGLRILSRDSAGQLLAGFVVERESVGSRNAQARLRCR